MRNRATLSPMNLTVRKPMTLAEFLEWEERQEQRYEFDGSEPVAMAGGSLAHSAIQRNLAMALWNPVARKAMPVLRQRPQDPGGGNSSRYPDGMVICSGLDPALKIVRNPVVIFEVLSPSTAAADRIVKAREYQATPSVQRYVMLEQARIGATVYVRAADGWKALVLKDDDTLVLPEIDLAIPLTEFYEGLTFDDHPAEDYDNEQTPPRLICSLPFSPPALIHAVREGIIVRLNDYWRSRSFGGNKVFEFVAQYLAIGDEARVP